MKVAEVNQRLWPTFVETVDVVGPARDLLRATTLHFSEMETSDDDACLYLILYLKPESAKLLTEPFAVTEIVEALRERLGHEVRMTIEVRTKGSILVAYSIDQGFSGLPKQEGLQ